MKNKKTKLIAIGLVALFVAIFAFTMPYMAMALAPFLLWSLAGQFAEEPPKEQEDLILKIFGRFEPSDEVFEDMKKDTDDYVLGMPPYSYRREH